MNVHVKPDEEPDEDGDGDGDERMSAAVSKLAFFAMLLSDHYMVCPVCMLATAEEFVEEAYGHRGSAEQ
jgi:hypothetical protein